MATDLRSVATVVIRKHPLYSVGAVAHGYVVTTLGRNQVHERLFAGGQSLLRRRVLALDGLVEPDWLIHCPLHHRIAQSPQILTATAWRECTNGEHVVGNVINPDASVRR